MGGSKQFVKNIKNNLSFPFEALILDKLTRRNQITEKTSLELLDFWRECCHIPVGNSTPAIRKFLNCLPSKEYSVEEMIILDHLIKNMQNFKNITNVSFLDRIVQKIIETEYQVYHKMFDLPKEYLLKIYMSTQNENTRKDIRKFLNVA